MAGFKTTKSLVLAVSFVAFIAIVFLILDFISTSGKRLPLLCSLPYASNTNLSSSSLSTQMATTILHYATNPTTPQQSKREISISLDVLLRRRPCNFLVFGLGYDSVMWTAFNPTGYTLFLEEDPNWVAILTKSQDSGFPLNARVVKYSTQLSQADDLLRTYISEPYCLPDKAYVRGNKRCKLALSDLPKEVYEREWDLIMIDAPRGYFPEAPGRMGAIWTAAVMARARKGKGATDVFLHDVNRKVEKEFALEFLCQKHMVNGIDRLWHFNIPAITADSDRFC